MDNFIRKRIDIATCWATNRISAMDTLERYEDSYAIAEEFRDITYWRKERKFKRFCFKLPKGIKKIIRPKNQRLNNKYIEWNPPYIIWVCLLL